MSLNEQVSVGDGLTLSNRKPMVLIAGVNVLEPNNLAYQVAKHLAQVCDRLGLSLIFKASWDKANRSSIRSYRGPGLERGLVELAHIKNDLGLPVITDVHAQAQVEPVAQVVDLLQVPAFLCRQTDLIRSVAQSGKPALIKKMQMMSPRDVINILEKFRAFGGTQALICERGTSFGYHRLVVDPLSFPELKKMGIPVVFDVTHSLQQPGGGGDHTTGRGDLVMPLAVAGVSQGISALFLECHPTPEEAKCDWPCAIPLNQVEGLVRRLIDLDTLVKSWT